MNKTGIEYGDYGWNFYPGCLHKPQGKCPVTRCWAESMTKRQQKDFHNPHLIPEKLLDPMKVKKPSRILVNFMGDLFGDWVDPEHMVNQKLEFHDKCSGYITDPDWSLKFVVFDVMKYCPQHTFLFLTKNPRGLLAWSPFPNNCWVGASVCNDKMLDVAVDKLEDVEAKNKFISFEPLLKRLTLSLDYALYYSGISWVIIGAQTRPTKMPKIEWVEEICHAATHAGIPVFIKNNLKPLYKAKYGVDAVRQELPE